LPLGIFFGCFSLQVGNYHCYFFLPSWISFLAWLHFLMGMVHIWMVHCIQGPSQGIDGCFQKMRNISGTQERAPLVSFGPSNYIIIDLNKPNIIRNGRELSSVQYLLTKPENAEYLQNAETRTSRIFFPFKVHNNRFKQAQDHKKRWRIEQCRASTYQTRKCGISPERGNAHLSSLLSL